MYVFSLRAEELKEKWVPPLYRAKHIIEELGASQHAKVRNIAEVATIASGLYIKGYQAVGTNYMRVNNVREFVCNVDPSDLVRIHPNADGLGPRMYLEEDDVVLARTGTLGKATLAVGPLIGSVMSQHVSRLRVKDGADLLPGYLAAFLNCELGKYQLVYSGYGSTRLELTHAALGDVRVPSIGMDYQEKVHRIVRASLSAYYESITRMRAAVLAIEQSIGFHPPAFSSRGFVVSPSSLDNLWTPRRYQPELVHAIDAVAKEFECTPLRDLATVQRGKGTRVSSYALSGVPFVRTSSLINHGIDPFPDFYATEDVQALFEQPVSKYDTLYSIEGKVGQVALLGDADECVLKNHVELVQKLPDVDIDPVYLYLVLASRYGKLLARRNTVVQATLPGMADRLRSYAIPTSPRNQSTGEFESATGEACNLAREAVALRDRAVTGLREARSIVEDQLALATA